MRTRRRAGHVFVISGPSGGGKTTVVKQLQRRFPRLVRSVSVTTRPPRPSERSRVDYQFVSVGTFQRLRRSGQLLEWARVHGAYYGTPRQPIVRALTQGRDAILSIDVQGARQVRQALGTNAVLVFLLPPSLTQLRQRLMRRRTDTPADVRKRLVAAKREMANAAWYDHRVVNDQLTTAVSRIATIIQQEKARSRTRQAHVNDARFLEARQGAKGVVK